MEGGPHNIGWTHPEEINAALVAFISDPSSASPPENDLSAAEAKAKAPRIEKDDGTTDMKGSLDGEKEARRRRRDDQ